MLSFARNSLSELFSDWKIIVIDNGSHSLKFDYRFKDQSDFTIYDCNIPHSLKDSILLGLNMGKEFNPSIISIWEHDALPMHFTLKNMIQVFIEERDGIGSVSPMYKLNSNYVYPTHNHWFSDPMYKNHPTIGKITTVHAIPFLFSIWNPTVMSFLDDPNLSPINGLDTQFGKKVASFGFKHLRLLDHSVGHYKGGLKTWLKK